MPDRRCGRRTCRPVAAEQAAVAAGSVAVWAAAVGWVEAAGAGRRLSYSSVDR
jgi:hypothetical protein